MFPSAWNSYLPLSICFSAWNILLPLPRTNIMGYMKTWLPSPQTVRALSLVLTVYLVILLFQDLSPCFQIPVYMTASLYRLWASQGLSQFCIPSLVKVGIGQPLVACSYRPNVCISPIFRRQILTPSEMVLGGGTLRKWGGHEGGTPINAISALTGEDPGIFFTPSAT